MLFDQGFIKRIQYLNSILGFCLFSLIIYLLILLPGATKYDPLLMDDVNHIILSLQILVVVLSLSFVLSQYNSKLFWIGSFLYIFITTAIIALPYARGYYLSARPSNDILIHLGYSRTILKTGNLVPYDWYPLQHIFTSILSMFGFPLRFAWIPFTSILFLTLLLGVVSFVRDGRIFKLSEHNNTGRIAAVGVIPYTFGYLVSGFQPAILSVLIFPLAIYIFMRIMNKNSSRYYVVLFILTISVVLFHPLSGALLLSIYLIISIIIGKFSRMFPLLSGTGVFYVTYVLSFERSSRMLYRFLIDLGFLGEISRYTSEPGGSVAGRYTSLAASANLNQILTIISNSYAPALSYFILASIIVFYLMGKQYYTSSTTKKYTLILISLFVFSGIYGVVLTILDVPFGSPLRNTKLLIIISIIIISDFILLLRRRSPKLVKESFLILIILIGCFSIGTVNLTSTHIQKSTFDGIEWSASYQTDNVPTISQSISRKMVSYRFGIGKISVLNIEVPDDKSLIEICNTSRRNSRYILTTPRDKIEYFRFSRAKWAQAQNLNQTEIRELNHNNNRIYDVEGYTVLFRHKTC